MESVRRAYNDLCVLLRNADLDQYIEPIKHVLEVERSRRFYRPSTDVKFLLIAESHVRVSPDRFTNKGPGFIYEYRYYTPWWGDFILPAFGTVRPIGDVPTRQPANSANRFRWLECLKSNGFWLLDVSLLSLSGYQKVDPHWPGRPLDKLATRIIKTSWILGARIAHIVTESVQRDAVL